MFRAFIFRITTLCDKKCPTCCCDKGQNSLDPEKYEEKLMQISRFLEKNPESDQPTVFLTGGEPFLYKKKSADGTVWNIVRLVKLTRNILPKSKIIIKTSGWKKNLVLDDLLTEVEDKEKEGSLEIRLGFNLFQNLGVNSKDRLLHMLSLLLEYQNSVMIETIYDKINKDETFKIMGEIFAKFLSNVENFGDQLVNPAAAYIIEFPFYLATGKSSRNQDAKQKVISLWTMPAHSGLIRTNSNQYFESENAGICENIQNGPSQIMFNADLSFNHCNDAFADYTNSAFPPDNQSSIEKEFLFLEEKFKKLKKYTEENPQFKTKNEQCTFCSKFIHDKT
jgi:hypothetical protein